MTDLQRVDFDEQLIVTGNVRHAITLSQAFRVSDASFNLPLSGTREILVDPTGLTPTATRGKLFVKSDQDIKIEYYEGVTVSANGTPLTVYNFNRVNDVPCNTAVYHTPTVTGPGLKYAPDLYALVGTWGVGVNVSTATPFSGADEFSAILNPTKKYLYKITNLNTTDPAKVVIEIRLVEEPNYPTG